MVIGFSCDNDSDTVEVEPFDYEGQIPIDESSIDEYLESHYYNTNDSIIYTIGNEGGNSLSLDDQLPLNEDPKLESIEGIEIVINDSVLSYKMYYYEIAAGIDDGNIGYSSPSPLDFVFVKYTGMLLDSTVFDSQEDYPVWFSLDGGVIEGWQRGMTKFKRGTFKESTAIVGDLEFVNPGKGYLIFSSGLGYHNGTVGGLTDTSNSPLIFRIELDDVKLSDIDSDLVPDKFEVTFDSEWNEIFEYTDGDDYDGDGVNDTNDVDDDNDYTLTTDEVSDEYSIDARGNINFTYDIDGNIIGKTGGVPNYKNEDNHLED